MLQLLASCAPAVRTHISKSFAPLAFDEVVEVIPMLGDAPKEGVRLGYVAVGDTGFSTDCSYETVVGKAKMEARKNGGNVIRIIKHTMPDIMSTCHRITAEVYRVDGSGSNSIATPIIDYK